MARLELSVKKARGAKVNLEKLISLLRENKVASAKTLITAIKADVDALNTAIQAVSNNGVIQSLD